MNPFDWIGRKKDEAMRDIILGIIRHALTSFGGAAVTSGYLTNSQMMDIVGATMVIIGVVWSIANKQQVAKTLDAVRLGRSTR